MKDWIEHHERKQAELRARRERESVVRIQAFARGRSVRKRITRAAFERAKEVVDKYVAEKKHKGDSDANTSSNMGDKDWSELAPGEPFTLEFSAGKLGMKVKKVENVTIVKEIIKGGMADMLAEGTAMDIEEGDEILEIAGKSVKGMTTPDIKALLRTAERPFKVMFRHKVKKGDIEAFAAKLEAQKEKGTIEEEKSMGRTVGKRQEGKYHIEGGGSKGGSIDTVVEIKSATAKGRGKSGKNGRVGNLSVDGSRTFFDRFAMLFSFSGEKTQPKRIAKRKRRKLYRLRPAAPADALATLNQLWSRLLKRGDLAMAQQTLTDLETKVKEIKRIPSANMGLKRVPRKRGYRTKAKSSRGALGPSGATNMIKGKEKPKVRDIAEIYNDSEFSPSARAHKMDRNNPVTMWCSALGCCSRTLAMFSSSKRDKSDPYHLKCLEPTQWATSAWQTRFKVWLRE